MGDVFGVANALAGNDGAMYCPGCNGGHGEDPTPYTTSVPPAEAYTIRNYSHKPSPNFKKTERDLESRALYFGTEVEIEMGANQSRLRALTQLAQQDTQRIFYCKADSSVRSGFELVTHPFTFDWMTENREAFDAQFNLSKLMVGWASEGCGMHVHMSVNAFSNLHLFKFMRFFHLNAGFIQAVSRRSINRLNQWAELIIPEKKDLMKYALNKGHRLGLGRGALNIEPRDTIECRIFRSTLSPTAYYGNIEFLQALFDYTKNCGVDDNELTKENYMSFVNSRGKAYNNFVQLAETIRPDVQDEMGE
jgi:hypothetical protein